MHRAALTIWRASGQRDKKATDALLSRLSWFAGHRAEPPSIASMPSQRSVRCRPARAAMAYCGRADLEMEDHEEGARLNGAAPSACRAVGASRYSESCAGYSRSVRLIGAISKGGRSRSQPAIGAVGGLQEEVARTYTHWPRWLFLAVITNARPATFTKECRIARNATWIRVLYMLAYRARTRFEQATGWMQARRKAVLRIRAPLR